MTKTYKLSDGSKVVFEYDHNGIGRITLEAMDILMSLLKATVDEDELQTDRPCDKCEWNKEYGRCIFEYCHYEYEQAHKDTPQTDCDRYVITNDKGDKEYNCIGCTQTDCGWK